MIIIIYIIHIALFGYGLYQLFRVYSYVEVKLSCGTFRVKRVFRYNANVMTRIISKEFFNGGKVDAAIMKELYESFGPVSWEYSGNFKAEIKAEIKAFVKRYF